MHQEQAYLVLDTFFVFHLDQGDSSSHGYHKCGPLVMTIA